MSQKKNHFEKKKTKGVLIKGTRRNFSSLSLILTSKK